MRQRKSAPHETANRLIDALADHALTASRGEIGRMVRENLSALSDDEIRRQIESGTRTHLDWIRVNGGIFGAIFGLLNFAIGHIPGLMAAFH